MIVNDGAFCRSVSILTMRDRLFIVLRSSLAISTLSPLVPLSTNSSVREEILPFNFEHSLLKA